MLVEVKQKELSPKRVEYLLNCTKKELLIRKQIEQLKTERRSAKRFVNVLGQKMSDQILTKARKDAEMATIAIKVLRRELHKDRIKGVPVVAAPDDELEFDADLHCKKCWYPVCEKGQGVIINYCPNCGRKLDWTGWV